MKQDINKGNLVSDWGECVAKFQSDKTTATIQTAATIADSIKANPLFTFNANMSGESKELLKRVTEYKKQKDEPIEPVIKVVYNAEGLHYAVDSSKPREGENLEKLIDCKLDIKDGELIEVGIEKISPKLDNGVWKIEADGVTWGTESINKAYKGKPMTTKEILYTAEALNILKCTQEQRDELFKLKLVKFKDNPLDDITKELKVIKDSKRQIVYGVVYEPMKIDAHGDYATKEEIEKAAHTFLAKYNSINLMHRNSVDNRVKVIESYIAPDNISINSEFITKGSWVMGVHIADKALWAKVESGELNAFSIEGTAKAGPQIM